MSRVLIVSATTGSNLVLANKISDLLDIDNDIICLEEYPVPLYTPKVDNEYTEVIDELCQKFIQSDGLVFCAPEYNGGSPPILTNVITWLSVSTTNWRDAFSKKKGLLASHSGGAGERFLSTFRVQLEHMGVIVYPRSIVVNRNREFHIGSVSKIVTGFIELL